MLCIRMWRTLYQKMAIKKSSNFHQLIANEGGQYPHPWRDLRSIPITNHLHHRNTQTHSSDRHLELLLIPFLWCAWNRTPLDRLVKLHSVMAGCMHSQRFYLLFERLYYPSIVSPPWTLRLWPCGMKLELLVLKPAPPPLPCIILIPGTSLSAPSFFLANSLWILLSSPCVRLPPRVHLPIFGLR